MTTKPRLLAESTSTSTVRGTDRLSTMLTLVELAVLSASLEEPYMTLPDSTVDDGAPTGPGSAANRDAAVTVDERTAV